MGGAQALNTLVVFFSGVQGSPARVTKVVGALATTCDICSFIEGSRKRESPDSGKESVNQLLQALRAAEKW